MVLKLYGVAAFSCTRRVAAVLHEKQVPFELINVDVGTREHKTPAYLVKQPFGMVPYIDDDGFILYESRAICHYIASKYAHQGTQGLLPPSTDLKATALFQQAASIELSNFNGFAEGAVEAVVYKKHFGLPPDMVAFEKNIAALDAKLDAYDAILGKQKYLAGDEVTLADLYHLPTGNTLPVAGSNIIETKPNVARWFKDISSRPSWQAVKDGVKTMDSY